MQPRKMPNATVLDVVWEEDEEDGEDGNMKRKNEERREEEERRLMDVRTVVLRMSESGGEMKVG